ncbi:hypothetical protein LCGC14_0386480 [marine sediment metagenome]|uniref:Uncharacterized protein n=1 Tax=marine sediment metagenome TaxID=412755 RepID=A0A0F9T6T4_9ZZZZ
MANIRVTEEERLTLLDRLTAGDPVAWGRLVIEERRQQLEDEKTNKEAQ